MSEPFAARGPEQRVDAFLAAASLEGVPSAFAATRDGIDALIRDRGLRRTTPDDTARSLLLGAAATASLEGSDVNAETLQDVSGHDATARAAVRLSTELLGLVPVWRRTPLQAIARIHAMAAAGTVSDDDLGRPGDPAGVARLSELGRAVSAPTDAPALVIASLAHAEIATCGAFASHAGVVARAVERLVIVERGVDPASVTVPEAGHAAEPEGYRSALAAYVRGDSAGVSQWLMYASQAFTRGAEASPLAR
ncbi:MAG: oxidoreductase [Aeromicrobium sp.]